MHVSPDFIAVHLAFMGCAIIALVFLYLHLQWKARGWTCCCYSFLKTQKAVRSQNGLYIKVWVKFQFSPLQNVHFKNWKYIIKKTSFNLCVSECAYVYCIVWKILHVRSMWLWETACISIQVNSNQTSESKCFFHLNFTLLSRGSITHARPCFEITIIRLTNGIVQFSQMRRL